MLQAARTPATLVHPVLCDVCEFGPTEALVVQSCRVAATGGNGRDLPAAKQPNPGHTATRGGPRAYLAAHTARFNHQSPRTHSQSSHVHTPPCYRIPPTVAAANSAHQRQLSPPPHPRTRGLQPCSASAWPRAAASGRRCAAAAASRPLRGPSSTCDQATAPAVAAAALRCGDPCAVLLHAERAQAAPSCT